MEKTNYDKASYSKSKSVAFSGHRSISEHRKEKLRKELREKTMMLYAMGIRNYYCGMAIGFDMLAAEVVLSLKSELPQLKLIAVVPFKGQSARWSYKEQARYNAILALCDDSILLSQAYYNGCLLRRNDYMLAHSCGLVVFFDGKPKGGTFYTYRKAKALGMDIINLF